MVEVLPPSMSSSLLQGPRGMIGGESQLSGPRFAGSVKGRMSNYGSGLENTRIPAWMQDSRIGPVDLPTPPSDMTDTQYNPLQGANGTVSFYKGVPLVPPNSKNGQPQDLSIVSRMQYMSKAPPSTDSRRSSSHTDGSAYGSTLVSSRRTSNTVGNDDGNIASYLQIPSSITEVNGNLAELAAKVTCLFWFESTSTLQKIEQTIETSSPAPFFVSEAFPTLSFQKWAATTLATTQVSKSVIILALLFIYRLKERNPGVKGKIGSEYRLLTVALMLGNKYLDDNTYTNKTWAEVSGISVGEVHVMEVEFLSNMRYTLYVNHDDWTEWEAKLGRFWSIIQRAQHYGSLPRLPQFNSNPFSTSKLPSPPTSTQGSPPYATDHGNLPLPQIRPTTNPPYLAPPHRHPSTIPPSSDVRLNGRKRSNDDVVDEPASKRVNTTLPSSAPLRPTLMPLSNHTLTTNIPMLPMPGSASLSATNNQRSSLSIMTPIDSSYPSSAVQPPEVNDRPDQRQQDYHRPTLPQLALGNNTMRDRHIMQPRTRAATPSPTSYDFPPSQYTTPHNLSPNNPSVQSFSYSPYKPVRMVDTLLYPPPSTSMHNPSHHIPRDNIRYHALQAGKRAPERVGTLPYHPYDPFGPGTFPQHQHQLQPLYH